MLQKHERVFRDLPVSRPPDRGFEHIIELEEGTEAVITTPYRHPKRYKDEIEKTIKELITEPSTRKPLKTGMPSLGLMN